MKEREERGGREGGRERCKIGEDERERGERKGESGAR